MGQANARINADRDKTQSGTRSKTRSQVEVFTANPQCLYIRIAVNLSAVIL